MLFQFVILIDCIVLIFSLIMKFTPSSLPVFYLAVFSLFFIRFIVVFIYGSGSLVASIIYKPVINVII